MFIFLAAPYSSTTPGLQEAREATITEVTARLMRRGQVVYSPITYGYAIAHRHELPHDAEFWITLNNAMLSSATALYVLTLHGWEQSWGVNHEMKFARDRSIPIYLIDPNTLTPVLQKVSVDVKTA